MAFLCAYAQVICPFFLADADYGAGKRAALVAVIKIIEEICGLLQCLNETAFYWHASPNPTVMACILDL
ncbi:hypothetical protein ACO0LC_27900 [Undibacterium sp. JH2W]|uniref:hypothetical protein n=1 Tax=Undibacterium sp. JH2W TaxID=3413037 RepID=UPI003BF3C766